jgi:hypothetical protein
VRSSSKKPRTPARQQIKSWDSFSWCLVA